MSRHQMRWAETAPYLTAHACRLHARLHAWMHGRTSSRVMFHLHSLPGLIHKLSDETKQKPRLLTLTVIRRGK